MAEEVQFSSGGDTSTAKRKYDGQSSPPPPISGRRTTGFSSQSPDAGGHNLNNVPLAPEDEIQAAKQRAQEIAARLFSNSNVDTKRPKVENGGSAGYDSGEARGFSSGPTDFVHKPTMNVASMPSSYGYPGPSKKIEIPNGRVGVIIGKGGETIKYLQLQSGAKIQVTRDMDADPNSPTRGVELMGTPEQVAKAEQLIKDVLNEAESGGSGIVSRRLPGQQSGAEQYVTMIPNNKVGLVIGKGGETIKNMQNNTGARIQVIPLHLPPGDPATERTLQIDGTSEQIEAAKLMVNEVISENRVRNPTGYSQQGYQARVPSNWAPSGQQQPGYGYVQPGAYAGQTPQYNTSQTQYPGYPPQPTSGGYATGWDQTSATTQQTTQGPGYDYYGQQSAPHQQAPGGAPGSTDNTGYGYNQQASAGYSQQGQGYTQDAYGAYHAAAPQSGYGQPQPGYDQQHGYNSTPGYGNVANPTSEGQNPSYGAQGDSNPAPPSTAVGQQGYNGSQQPSPNPNYPPQQQPGYGVPPNSQTGYGTQPSAGYGPSYGAPQAQKPAAGQPVYGQHQQSPTAQGGYVQPAPMQPGYPHSQPPSGYGTAPASGYAAAPPSYGAAPPATQPSYAGQQPPYNSSYATGYSQPPVYSADANAAPASQTVPPNAAAKTSPQS